MAIALTPIRRQHLQAKPQLPSHGKARCVRSGSLPLVAKQQDSRAVLETPVKTPNRTPTRRPETPFPGLGNHGFVGRIKRSNSTPTVKNVCIDDGLQASDFLGDASGGNSQQWQDKAIIFDWDDTLLPTTFVNSVIAPSRPRGQLYAPVTRHSPFYPGLLAVGQAVRELLTTASKFGRVALVTLSQRPWVVNSADWFLPGLDLQELLDELQIPVYYASEHVSPQAFSLYSQEVFVTAKRSAMETCLNKLFGRASNCKSVMSIGDSEIELFAIQALVDSLSTGRKSPVSASTVSQDGPQCKTVLLCEKPPLVQLKKQLALLISCLEQLDAHQGNLDLELDIGDPRTRGWI
eukprot:gb/GFBE01030268.1/.p1 GENE.gb/GFBE01030268.1/~~gb/GFBE01030268.1/.p1  ORF type:complete len:349 (+),score=40.55 gb/GFBE01030268.1/:1-1047(+)